MLAATAAHLACQLPVLRNIPREPGKSKNSSQQSIDTRDLRGRPSWGIDSVEIVLDDVVDVQMCWHPWNMAYFLCPHSCITSSSPKAFPRSSRYTRASTRATGVSLKPRQHTSRGISKSVKDRCSEVPVKEFRNSPSKGKWFTRCHDARLYSFNLGFAGEIKNAIPGRPKIPRTRLMCSFDDPTAGSANNAE
jgi:hypothetical protein